VSRKLLFIPIAVAVAALAASLYGVASAQDASPTSGSALAEGYSATGSAVGSDGALYVPTGGTGGDQVLEPPPEAGFDGEVTFGLTATIVRIDPDDGTVTTVAENLPSVAQDGEGGGISDVEFIGTTMYFLLTGSADKLGVPEWPNGVYRVTNNGTDAALVADISAYNDSHPVTFEDAAPGGNPFALERRGTGFVVSDGNYNRLLNVQSNGVITLLVAYDNIVPTGLALGPSGSVLNTWFSPAPHLPGESKVVSVASDGDVTQLASGPVSMIDVSIGPDGNVYVLQFSDFVADETAPPQPTGRIYQLEGGVLTLLVDGFVLPTSLNFAGDTAFVTTLVGTVWMIEDFSSISPLPAPTSPTAVATQPGTSPTQAPAPAATATRTGGTIGAPDTGDGAGAGGSSSTWMIVAAISAGGVVFAASGARLARNRR
jgi:hypothetical protein